MLFRTDLRVADNRALSFAASSGKPVTPVFILEDEENGSRVVGGARRWWMHHSLQRLAERLRKLGSPLVLRRGGTRAVVDSLIAETGADTVLWNRRYEPPAMAVDAALKTRLRGMGLAAESFDGHLLHEPSKMKTSTGGPYKVYTPFWRALCGLPEPREPLPAPGSLKGPGKTPASDLLDDLNLLPQAPDWAGGLRDSWSPGEDAAHERLEEFIDAALDGYADGRERPGHDGTSRLSPHLAHGEITPYQMLHVLRARGRGGPARDLERFRMEIGWREFCYHLLYQQPDLTSTNFNRTFDRFPWRQDSRALRRWQRGETGYPIVDAGMRQLWLTGWMHNRVRMVVASFLVKHLLIDWRDGEAWFWDTLVDADPASNPANWQWVAGSGADAAPYFRVFNPVLQGEKFDPQGRYVRRFVPELADLPDAKLHKPWEASGSSRSRTGVNHGKEYPVPIVDHGEARARALEAYETMRGEQ